MANPSPIETLLRLVPDNAEVVMNHLSSHPELASQSDSTGYSLLHAASSYSQLDLLRALVKMYGASPDMKDEDGETPLFVAESVAAAKCLVEELGADRKIVNDEGLNAEENASANIEDGSEWMLVADYLRKARVNTGEIQDTASDEVPSTGPQEDGLAALPPGVRLTGIQTVREENVDAPDPEFRRRIEELAAREDFHEESGQTELRSLVTDAVGGLSAADDDDRDVRRRTA